MDTGRDFEGRRAIVTGAAAGIGRAIAFRLARAGARVGCLDVNERALATQVRHACRSKTRTSAERVTSSAANPAAILDAMRS